MENLAFIFSLAIIFAFRLNNQKFLASLLRGVEVALHGEGHSSCVQQQQRKKKHYYTPVFILLVLQILFGLSWLLIFIKCMNYRCMTSFWNGITYGLDCSYNFFQVNIFPSSMQEVMAVRAKY